MSLLEKKECEHCWIKQSGECCYKCGALKCEAQPCNGMVWCNCDQHLNAPKPSPEPEKCMYGIHSRVCSHLPEPKPDAVEEQIGKFLRWIHEATWGKIKTLQEVEKELRELVRIVKESK